MVETVVEPACPGLNAAEPATELQSGEQVVLMVVLYDGAGLLATPGLKDLLDCWKCTPDDVFRPPGWLPILGSGIAIPVTPPDKGYGAMVKVHKPSWVYAAFPEAP